MITERQLENISSRLNFGISEVSLVIAQDKMGELIKLREHSLFERFQIISQSVILSLCAYRATLDKLSPKVQEYDEYIFVAEEYFKAVGSEISDSYADMERDISRDAHTKTIDEVGVYRNGWSRIILGGSMGIGYDRIEKAGKKVMSTMEESVVLDGKSFFVAMAYVDLLQRSDDPRLEDAEEAWHALCDARERFFTDEERYCKVAGLKPNDQLRAMACYNLDLPNSE